MHPSQARRACPGVPGQNLERASAASAKSWPSYHFPCASEAVLSWTNIGLGVCLLFGGSHRETPIGWPRVRKDGGPDGRFLLPIDQTIVRLFAFNELETAPAIFCVIVAVAALALAGCNANQMLDPSGQAELRKVYYPNYNPYDPTKYGQTSGVYVSSS